MAMEAAGVLVDHAVSLTGFADDDAIPTWAKSYASAAVREGLITGISTAEGLSFCGEDAITLGEAAAMMDRLLNTADAGVPTLSAGRDWAAQAVANMEAAQVVAAGSFGSAGRPITQDDYQTLDSPYNTYLNKGLPPGPIASPGMVSLNSALNPQSTNYYYYAVGDDNLHHYFRTNSEFQNYLASLENSNG